MKINKRLYYLIAFLLAVICLVFAILGHVFDFSLAIEIILHISSIILFIITTFLLLSYRQYVNNENQLKVENIYNLGVNASIDNIYYFEKKAHNLIKKKNSQKKNRYIIAFTCGNLNVMANSYRNEEVMLLNAQVSAYLLSNFKKETANRDYLFCFDKGVFIVYAFGDEKIYHRIIKEINDAIFDIANSNDYHLWVQPFFGVYEIDEEQSIYHYIDNALLARDISEQNFETFTKYDKSLRISTIYDENKSILDALDNEEFVVYYQPKYSLKEKKFISAEALVRWNHPTLGLLSPHMFIEKAERGGLIHNIDTYVFEHVCVDLKEAIRKGKRVIPISVNFSLYEFFSNTFLNVIIDTIDKYELPHNLIEIEITETTSQANQFLSISIIKKLKEHGIRVLMDDFGMGYSGIDNLRKIPFDAVKIDKSFTDLIIEDDKTRNIIKLLVELAHNSEIEVVVEGVDKKEQIDFLKKVKCDTIQGFYYSKPLDKEKYELFLKENEFENRGKKL